MAVSADFWSKAAALAFSLWSLMLPITATIVINKMNAVMEAVADNAKKHDSYVLSNQQRMILIEERQGLVLRTLEYNGLLHMSKDRPDLQRPR